MSAFRRITLSARTVALLVSLPAVGRAGPVEVTLELNTATVGRNLVPNPSFEAVENALPKGWRFSPRNTDATFAVVTAAHSGRRAVRFTNGTPQCPQVYGQLVLTKTLSLTPGKTYTLSCYARSDDPGPAWIGGGDGWWMRLGLRGTGGKWKRFSKTFTARPGDVRFPLMINTDGVTQGFTVDDVKLEEGEVATPVVVPGETAKFQVQGEVPEVVASRTDTVRLEYYLYAPRSVERLRVSVTATGEDKTTLGAASRTLAVPAGVHGLHVRWQVANLRRQSCRLTLRVAQGTTVLAMRTDRFELVSRSSYTLAKRGMTKAAKRLDEAVAAARAAGKSVPYAVAARAVVRRFTAIAEAKLKADALPEAVTDVQFLTRVAEQAATGAAAIAAGKQPERHVPNPPFTDVRIRAGNFVVAGRPVMIVGGMGYGELEQALPTVHEYGFNTVGDDYDNGYSCLRMMTGPGQHDDTAVPKLRKSWDRLRKLNLAISFNPTLHYFPDWALKKYPDITGGDLVDRLPDWSGLGRHKGKRTKTYGGFFPFAIDSPSLRKLVGDYYAVLFSGVAHHPAFRLVWVMNEPTYSSNDRHYVQLYRAYLQRKFGNITKANAVWGTHYDGFASVTPPTRSDSPEVFDWLTFHQDQVASWFEWLAAEIRKHDRRSLLSNKPMAWTLLHPNLGIDWEREAELWDVPGCDASRNPTDRTYSFGWQQPTMCFDFQKSVAPDKPLGDFEYHYSHRPGLSEEYAYATYWHSYLHGLRWSNFWVWATGSLGKGKAGAGMRHTAWSQPRVAWGTVKAALDLRRLVGFVAAFPGKPQVRLYFSRASLYRDNSRYPGILSAAYQAANGLDAPVGFVTDKMIRAGKLAAAKLVVVPAARYVETDVLRALHDYVAGGGHLVLIGECLTVDEYGRKHPADLVPSGKHVMHVDGETARQLVAPLDKAESEAGVERPVRCLSAAGRPAWPVECRSVLVGNRRIVSLIGLNKEPKVVRLVARPPGGNWTDILTGTRIEGSTFTVQPLDVRLLSATDHE